MSKLKTINELYKYSKSANRPLLSSFNAPFWQEYIDNYARYDKLFNRTYFTFKYFLQDGSESLAEITSDFTDAVYEHLMVNRKKYEELYRVYILADEKYSLTDNYDITETMDRDTYADTNDTFGSRHDTSNDISKVVPYDTTNEFEDGSNSGNYDKGSQIDSHLTTGTEDYTLHRKGNIGVTTITDMISKHDTYWSKYRFYTMIFENISRELLLV